MSTNGSQLSLACYHERWTRYGAPLLDHLGAVLYHVRPYSEGGEDTEGNLVTACNKCNARKNNSAAEAHQKRYPYQLVKLKFGEPVRWDRFSTLFVALARRYLSELTVSEAEWLKALTESPQ